MVSEEQIQEFDNMSNHIFQLINYGMADSGFEGKPKDIICAALVTAMAKMLVFQYHDDEHGERDILALRKYFDALFEQEGRIKEFLYDFNMKCIKCGENCHEDH